ncbi:MAG: hypothetical protein QOJ63_3764, partial [Solirubrobacteraceae bacterium]|nr:hypothetical protein [Solirubrobacteraceae bacterium]
MMAVASAERLLPGGATWSHVLERGDALDVEDVEGAANAALLLLN